MIADHPSVRIDVEVASELLPADVVLTVLEGHIPLLTQRPARPLPASAVHIIVALAGGEKDGYAIMRDVEELSGGTVRMGPGARYGSIKRMIDQGLLEETEERPDPALDDERRRYYRFTSMPAGSVWASAGQREPPPVGGARRAVGLSPRLPSPVRRGDGAPVALTAVLSVGLMAAVVGSPAFLVVIAAAVALAAIAVRTADRPIVAGPVLTGRWGCCVRAGAVAFAIGFVILVVDGDELTSMGWTTFMLSWATGTVLVVFGAVLGASRVLRRSGTGQV